MTGAIEPSWDSRCGNCRWYYRKPPLPLPWRSLLITGTPELLHPAWVPVLASGYAGTGTSTGWVLVLVAGMLVARVREKLYYPHQLLTPLLAQSTCLETSSQALKMSQFKTATHYPEVSDSARYQRCYTFFLFDFIAWVSDGNSYLLLACELSYQLQQNSGTHFLTREIS